MKQIWQLQEAKSRFSEVVENARQHGPQVITKRGAETAVLLSYADYRKLVGRGQLLSMFFMESPLAGIDLDLSRDTSLIRDEDVRL